jgi:acetyl-CoA synthetase
VTGFEFPVISKRAHSARRRPNMTDYEAERARFSWEAARRELSAQPGSRRNIGFEALDRHVTEGRGNRLAVRFIDRDGQRRDLSFGELLAATNRCANAWQELGLRAGDRVFSLLPRGPALHIAALAALRSGLVFCPLFPAFGPEPIRTRLALGEAAALVTSDVFYARKIAAIRPSLPKLRIVLLTRSSDAPVPADTHDFDALLARAAGQFTPCPTSREDIALLHFTSGTTGQPKGVLHVHDVVTVQYASARFALDLQDGDRYWCTADPGWVTGMAYGIIAPLVCGISSIVDQEEFEPQRWYRLLAEERITVWYTAPTAIRMMMKAGTELARARSYPDLRFLGSVGEPLNPEAVLWGIEAFGLPFHDNWWQTETGAIMIANYAALDIRPGSMGLPLPGIEAAIVSRDADGRAEPVADPQTTGELALKAPWPAMFRGYLNQDEKYRACFSGEWYLTGDLARRDRDGYYWFIGRSDDVIKSAGHLISPFEVESALMTHPAVAQAGAIGVPDPIAGHVVKAFVELRRGYQNDPALQSALLAHARRHLGPAVAPRSIAVIDALPRTRSGKIMRRVLKARELGLPEGDLSTLEGGA